MRPLRVECPGCEHKIEVSTLDAASEARCRRCATVVPLTVSPSLRAWGIVDRCCVCGNKYFYIHKDFHPALGCLLVAVGIAFSYHTYGLSLVACAALDFVVYQFVGLVTVCYQCRSEYRRFAKHPRHYPFDMKVAEWHLKRTVMKEERS